MTIGDSIKKSRRRIAETGSTTPELDALVLLEHACGKPRTWLHAHANEPIDSKLQKECLQKYEELVAQRINGIPVAYLIGRKEFHGLSFSVSPDVMTPRPESEALVDYVLENAPKEARVIDMGTGCGALAVSLKASRPDLDVTASDVSAEALAIARDNASDNNTSLRFQESDLFSRITGTFDVIIANLPYLKPDAELTRDAEQEPKLALDGGDKDGLGIYRRFLQDTPGYLNPGGIIVLESDPWQHLDLIRFGHTYGLRARDEGRFLLALERTS